MMTAFPCALISFQSAGSSCAYGPAFRLKTVVTCGMFLLNHASNLLEEHIGAVESRIDEIDGLAIEARKARSHRNQLYGRRHSFGIYRSDFGLA